MTHTDVRDIAAMGTDIFAGTDGGVFLSTDNGTNWTAVNNGLTDTLITGLAVLGTNLFAATDGGGVFLSTNSGTTWTAVNNFPSVTSVNAFAASGANVFAATNCGVFVSTDTGSSWTQASNGLMRLTVHTLVVSGGNLFAAADEGVPIGGWFGGPQHAGVFLSTDDGTSWTAASCGLPNSRVMAFAVSGSHLLAGTKGSGVFLSTNTGRCWRVVNTGLGGYEVDALATSGGQLFAACGYYTGHGDNSWYVGQGVYLSSDTGTTWIEANAGLPPPGAPGVFGGFLRIGVLLACSQAIYAGTDGGGVYRTTNNGTSWAELNTGLTDSIIDALTLVGTNLFAGTSVDEGNGGGVFVSTNSGTSWTRTGLALSNYSVTSFAVAGSNLFAGTQDGVFLSTDNGTSWTDVSKGLTEMYVQCLAVNGTDLILGNNEGLWRRSLLEMIVPVELNSFTATANGKEVTLSWSTATELNNQGFEVQRKFGSNDFVTVGSVKGHGTTTSPNNYTYIDKLADAGKYFYRLKQIDYGGKYEYSQTVEVNWSPFTTYKLEQNYPNPFNPATTIGFGIPEKGNVKISVLNILGEEIRILLNEEKEAGYHAIDFSARGGSAYGGNASELPSGVYFYQLKAGSFVETKKMVLLR